MDQNLKYYKDNENELCSKYPNQYALIKDAEFVDAYQSFEEAIRDAIEKGYEPGSFIIQLCSTDDAVITQRFHSRVVFA